MKHFSQQTGDFGYKFSFTPKTGECIWGLNLAYKSGAVSDFSSTYDRQVISGLSGIGNSSSLQNPYLFLGDCGSGLVEVYYNEYLEKPTGEDSFYKINRLTGDGFTGVSGFGYAIQSKSDGLAVGAPYSKINDQANAGATFVFSRTLQDGGNTGNNGWGQITAFSGTASGAFYGKSVDLTRQNTNLLLVAGAPGENSGSGAIYMHNTSPNTLIKKIDAVGSGIQSFGKEVQFIEKDSIRYILSAYDQEGTGKIDVFKESAPNLNDFTKSQTLSPDEGHSGDMYGYQIASFSGSFLVGAPKIGGSGKVYYYNFNPELGEFTESQKIYPDSLAAGNLFGKSLDFDGDHAIITASEISGSGYIYKSQGSTLEYVSSISGSLTSQSGAFGGNASGFRSASIEGDVIVIGENNSPSNPNYNYYISTGEEVFTEYTGVSISGSGGKLFDSENNFIYGYSPKKTTVISGSVFSEGDFSIFVNTVICNSSSSREAGLGLTGSINSWTMTGESNLNSYTLTIFND